MPCFRNVLRNHTRNRIFQGFRGSVYDVMMKHSMAVVWRTFALLVWFIVVVVSTKTPLPHILFMVADDLGYNDVGFQGSEIPTPNLDQLARQGVRLGNYNVMHLCTPFRSAMMTGRYPIRYGLQEYVITAAAPYGLSLNETILPQALANYGYHSHAVGKWHLGFFNKQYLPTRRGFETFHGFYGSDINYFSHDKMTFVDNVTLWGYDFRQYEDIAPEDFGVYSLYVAVREIERVLRNHDATKPLFLYVPWQAPHSPAQSPDEYIYNTACRDVLNDLRRKYCGLVAALDDAVGKVKGLFERYGLWNNTLTIFTNDNGGMSTDGGNNTPLRGEKFTLWEGGVRGTGFVHGPMFNHRAGTIERGLMHCVDWFPTLMGMARRRSAKPAAVSTLPLDGLDVWDTLVNGQPSPRVESLINIDNGPAAIRVGPWKYMIEYDMPYFPVPNSTQFASFFMIDSELQEWLFNLDNDPIESVNLLYIYPNIADELRARLAFYRSQTVPSVMVPSSLDADPVNFPGNFWSPWVA